MDRNLIDGQSVLLDYFCVDIYCPNLLGLLIGHRLNKALRHVQFFLKQLNNQKKKDRIC